MKKYGNKKAKKIWERNIPDGATPPTRDSPQSYLEKWLRDKYVYKEFK